VGDSEIARLCRQIYHKHRRALDLIYDHRSDPVAEVKSLVEGLVEDDPRFELDSTLKNKTRFAVLEWDKPALLMAEGWSRSKRILLFEFWYYPSGLWLMLFVGPGPDETRQRLVDMVTTHPDIFKVTGSWGKWSAIYTRTFLEEEMHEDAKVRDEKIRRRWSEFLEHDLPRIDAVIKREGWIWQHPGDAEST
jgi:hypothetical protein